MQDLNKDTIISAITEGLEDNGQTEDYALLLKSFGVNFKSTSLYLEAGEPKQTQGWILHISSISSEYKSLLREVLPVLIAYGSAFKILPDQKRLLEFNNGVYGNQKVGKAITILLEDQLDFASLLERLIEKTKDFIGPRISTDQRICHNLYYRYGSYQAVIAVDAFGNRDRMMQDKDGNYSKDCYSDPPVLPQWLKDPFAAYIQQDLPAENSKLFFQKYRPVKLLKADKKGDVYQGIYYQWGCIPVNCIIKQGRMGIFSDERAADMRERIIWQYQLMQELESYINIPKALDLFRDKEQCFLVQSFVPGETLAKKAYQILDNRPWWKVRQKGKKEIIRLLIQVVDAIKILHEKGIIHRDISPNNFMVDRGGKVFLIDLELAYRVWDREPKIPFQQGTPGYLSPQQFNYEPPTFTDDYYAIGALILYCMTGMEPALLPGDLSFFFHDEAINNFLKQCFDADPGARPDLNSMHRFLKGINCLKEDPLKINVDAIPALLNGYIKVLSGDQMAHENLWYAYVNNPYDRAIYPLQNKAVFPSIYKGVGGPLYFLLQAAKAGMDISPAEKNRVAAWQYILTESNPKTPSLFYGSAGIAVLIVEAIRAGVIPDDSNWRQVIEQSFQGEPEGIDLMHGLAGKGMAILQCADYPDKAMVSKISMQLISLQGKDGSWRMQDEKINGFRYGIAGIVYFLLEYGKRYHQQEALVAAEKGLQFLMHKAVKRRSYYEWKNSDRVKQVGRWFCHGGPGIALAFLKGYEVMGKERYRRYAEQALRIHGKELVTHQLSLCHGAAGLGEIYLEAWRITKDKQWWERAERIAALLIAMHQRNKDGEVFWLVEQHEFPTAELFTGSSGIAHFLLRFLYPEKIGFPLLNN